MFIGKQRYIYKDHTVNVSGFYWLQKEQNIRFRFGVS